MHTQHYYSHNMDVKFALTNTTQFFIGQYPIIESDKALSSKEMRKGLVGILKEMYCYFNPIMFIPRQLTGIPGTITNFRHLNSRLTQLNP